jgi:ATP-dependent Clp protease protease subunit
MTTQNRPGSAVARVPGDPIVKPPASYRMLQASAASAEIFLYDVIGSGWMGGISAEQFAQDLRALGSVRTIDLRINSDGGDVFEGRTIYTLLNEHPANIVVHVDGLAASIASLIAMAGDSIVVAEGAMMMVHNAWGLSIGNAADMRRQADLLDTVDQGLVKTYCARTGMDAKKCAGLLAAETWMTSQECVDFGFADSTTEPMQVAACVRDLVALRDGRIVTATERFRALPTNLRPRRAAAAAETDNLRRLFERRTEAAS